MGQEPKIIVYRTQVKEKRFLAWRTDIADLPRLKLHITVLYQASSNLFCLYLWR